MEELIARAPEIPVAKGMAFYESCPDDNTRLAFDPYAPSRHVCPRCGRDWQGRTFDLAWVRQFQDWLGKRLVEAGILYKVEGDERFAQVVREALDHFVRRYRDYPLANNLLGPTRLFQSTYLEAFWLVDIVAAYDLTQASGAYSEADHRGVRNLLYESCGVVRSFDEGVSNRQAFNNAGMGAVALLYGDEALLEHVLAGPHGFSFHMRESLLEDGIWYEGETYHFATLDHSLNLAEMARHRGIDLYEGASGFGSLRVMFDGPLKVMLPDLTFPSRKDSWYGRGIGYHKEVYELGFARYRDERYGGLLASAYAGGADRRELSWRSFLYLEPDLPSLPDGELRPKRCEPMPGTGVAVLRRDEGRVYASLEYGHYGGGHGHPDRLHLTLVANGAHWLLDPGTGWYHVPELGWYRSTLAHNTVSVDGRLQTPQEGSLTAFGDAGGFQVAQARVQGAYPGTVMRRTLCLGDGFLLDVVDLTSEAPEGHRYDWAFHTPGRLRLEPPATAAGTAPVLGERDGYEFLSEVKRLPGERLDLTAELQGKTLRVLQLGEAETFVARAPGVPLWGGAAMSSVIVRREASRDRFATLWLWSEGQDEATFASESEGVFRVELRGQTYRLLVDDTDGLTVVAGADKIQRLAWFGRREVSLGGAALNGPRALAAAALIHEGGAWNTALPADFGTLRITGLALDPVKGLPEGATWRTDEEGLSLRQAPGSALWLDSPAPLTLFAGCESSIALNVASYGLGALVPAATLPPDWRLLTVTEAAGRGPMTARWTLAVALPSVPQETEGEVSVEAGGQAFSLPYRVVAPLAVEWRVDSQAGVPGVTLMVKDARGLGGAVTAEIEAPWLEDVEVPATIDLPAGASRSIRLLLPLRPPPGQSLRKVRTPQSAKGVWRLPGLTAWCGDYVMALKLSLSGFTGVTQANLPLYWSAPNVNHSKVAETLRLSRADQALWADRRWRDEADASAEATVTWSPAGLHLSCRVVDDVHVSDGNQDDLYENDSLQVYFDFRQEHHAERDFAPGVAAYILAPSADKRAVRIQAIAGNREISNRGVQARWFTTEGVQATSQPTSDGYRIEAFFPYASLGVDALRPGRVLGFDLSLSDNDGTWYRNTQLLWSGSRGRRCYIRGSYHDPREFGWLIVGEPGEAREATKQDEAGDTVRVEAVGRG